MSQETNERSGASPNHPPNEQPNLLSTEPTIPPQKMHPQLQSSQGKLGHSGEPRTSVSSDVGLPQNSDEAPYNSHSAPPTNAYPTLPGAAAQMPNGNGVTGSSLEESPDLLRWRADSLLDEMVLGSADGSATQAAGAPHPFPDAQVSPAMYDMGAPVYGEGPAHDGSPVQTQLPVRGEAHSEVHSEVHSEQVRPQTGSNQINPNQGDPNQGNPNLGAVSQQVEQSGMSQNQPTYGHVRTDEVQQHEPPGSAYSDVPHSTHVAPANPSPIAYPAQGNQFQPAVGQHSSEGQNLPSQPGAFHNPASQQPAPQFPNQQQPPPYQQPPAQNNLRPPTAAQHYPTAGGNTGYGMTNNGQPSNGAAYGEQSIPPAAYGGNQPHPSPQGGPTQPLYPHPETYGQDEYSQGAYNPNNSPRAEWGTQPSFEQGYSPRVDMPRTDQGYDPRYGQERMSQEPMGQDRPMQERNQQPLDPATYYAQQIAWRREQERKQWAISSGSSSDYLTSVPRYEETQNRTATYFEQASSVPGWQNSRGYPSSDHPPQGYPSQYEGGGYNQPGAQNYSQGSLHANPAYSPHLGPVNPGYGGLPTNMPFAERMDVGAQAQRHSNLLPRRSQMSVDALYEEMTVLQSQVDMALPIYGDSADRAMHLLEKGRTILQQNPERSAEVSYYVQQVSGIIQRGKQRLEWSDMYRSRLSRYLTAWLVLGSLGLIGSFVYGPRIVESFSTWFPSAARFFSSHLTAILLVLAASTIGSALAALTNMWRHSQKEYGFFDRKYGLLGVLLPLMGIIVGLAIYFIVAIVYLFLNITPNTSWLTMILPALFALIYAASQERIYGTSE